MLSDALTCYNLSVSSPATMICFAVITAGLGGQWEMTTRDENTLGVKCDSLFSTCVWFFWEGGVSVRQLEWQVEPAGHPRPGLNPMIGSSGARPDKQFHLRHITDTEWKFGCYCRVGDFFLWALLCLCQSGVLLSPWWQCDGPWAPQEWRRTHLKWEVWCIIIFVESSLVNPRKTNHKETVSAPFFSRLVTWDEGCQIFTGPVLHYWSSANCDSFSQ